MKNLTQLKNNLELNSFCNKPEQSNSWLVSYTQFTPFINTINFVIKIRSRIELFMSPKLITINLC